MKTYTATAKKTSKVPAHVHATMFIKGNEYSVTKTDDPDWVRVSGKFRNSLGGHEYKEQSIQKTICAEHLTICLHANRVLVDSGGDAESGPITITACTECGKQFTQFGM